MTALSNIEAKKRFEFLEAVSGTMDAHLRYFKQVCSCYCFHIDNSSLSTNVIQAHSTAIFFQGYELLHQMEPYINQVTLLAKISPFLFLVL